MSASTAPRASQNGSASRANAQTRRVTSDEPLSTLLTRNASRIEIADHLDLLSASARMEQVLAVGGRGVKKLYDTALGAPPISLEEIVPLGNTSTVILEGRNSLPAFSRFQKRFARVGAEGTVIGYNHQTLGFATGPGYFVVKPAESSGKFKDEILFDYTEAPPAEPAGWPRYVSNSRGLSRAVFMNMHDYCRRVAKGVLVGKAYKKGVEQNAYFTLTSAT